jgi:hypothetical protein
MKVVCQSSRSAELQSSNRRRWNNCDSARAAAGRDGAPRRSHVHWRVEPGYGSPRAVPRLNGPRTAQRAVSTVDGVELCAAAQRSESGVALVITLILLSVITFMAIAFLVLSRGQKSSVTTTTDETIARQAADAALARAQAEMIAPILASTNPFNYTMLVSTNYISPIGFTPGNTSPTNVSYVGRNGAFLAGRDALQNLANLEFNPRPPVFITNRLSGSNDFRYYLDLNRNGIFEPSGWVGQTNTSGLGILTTNGTLQLSYQMGDPQWIGQLEFPDHTHAADNRFISRYAYMVVPISQTLDINYIHNQANNPNKTTFDPFGRDYLRNQGVGTWEMNLASFLYDLNTNIYAWGGLYTYQPATPENPAGPPIAGNAFVDAFSILKNRYANLPTSLAPVATLFANGAPAFSSDYIDGYSAGPIMTVKWRPFPSPDATRTTRPWSGADNTNHFFSSQDLFDVTKTSTHFTNALLTAGSKTNSYDRYTFYRLLSQLGTDSSPEPANKINLNYDNLVQKNVLGVSSATNFFPWKPLDFFTNVASALLANAGYTNLTLSNIPVYPTNYYTASVHRLLQLAANIYDASTNRAFVSGPGPSYPSVFRPLFRRITVGSTNLIFVAGFREVLGTDFAFANRAPAMLELDSGAPGVITKVPLLGIPFRSDQLEPMISGMPLIVGAKKGLPNFNEFSMQTYVYITRILQFHRSALDGPVTQTNQMYVVALTNQYGLEAWNSYSNTYPQNLRLIAAVDMTAIITNDANRVIYSNRVSRAADMHDSTINPWRGWKGTLGRDLQSFILPFVTTNFSTFLSNSTVANQPSTFVGNWVSAQNQAFVNPGQFYVPNWWLNLNTRLRFILLDVTANRIVDYVNLNHWEPTFYLTTNLTYFSGTCQLGDFSGQGQWGTNRQHGSFDTRVPTIGVLNQIAVGEGLAGTIPDWNNFSMNPYAGQDVTKAIQFFNYNMGNPVQGLTFTKSNIFYAPFNSYAAIFISRSLEANDPLIHYTLGDLVDLTQTNNVAIRQPQAPLWNDLGQVNSRYAPWGFAGVKFSTGAKDITKKDPLVTRSDDWDFPTNKFPNVGWLGRVHRGTPWQTVYLKSPNLLFQPGTSPKQNLLNWNQWTGNQQLWGQVTNRINNQTVTNWVPIPPWLAYAGATNFYDSLYSLPTNDWRILDLFTTAINDNATRGQLSVNQTNLAAWSAVLGGVNVLPDLLTNSTFITPAGFYTDANPTPLALIVKGIINSRTNFPNKTYQRLGDILATPQLSVASPYLTTRTNFMNDEVYERIPQQIMGLLRTGDQPRFVIYSYGQALKPAPRSVIPNSIFGNQFVNLCTNYQITAEVATRAVVRIDGAPTNTHAVVESFNVLPPD